MKAGNRKKRHQSGVPDSIKQAAAAGRRSSLYLWMFKNYQEFGVTLADAGRPNWTALAAVFKDEGLTDLKGQNPTPEAARLTWFKVRQAKNKQQRKPASAKSAPPTAPAKAPEPEPDDDDGFKFKRLKL